MLFAEDDGGTKSHRAGKPHSKRGCGVSHEEGGSTGNFQEEILKGPVWLTNEAYCKV